MSIICGECKRVIDKLNVIVEARVSTTFDIATARIDPTHLRIVEHDDMPEEFRCPNCGVALDYDDLIAQDSGICPHKRTARKYYLDGSTMDTCTACHQMVKYTNPQGEVIAEMLPIASVA